MNQKSGSWESMKLPNTVFIYIVHTTLCLVLNLICHKQAMLHVAIICPEAIESSLFFSSITHFKLL